MKDKDERKIIEELKRTKDIVESIFSTIHKFGEKEQWEKKRN